jgi:nucleoside-diphosphate-sugar epimerase
MMKVLITGATGYLGAAVSHRLLEAGHQVRGMARSAAGLQALAAAGVEPVRGDLSDPIGLRAAADAVDAVIETASADHAESTAVLAEYSVQTGKRFVRTSGVAVYTELTDGETSDVVHREGEEFTPIPLLSHRYDQDLSVLAAAGGGGDTVVLRPGMVYGQGASEQLPVLLRAALRDGVSRYVGRGLNRYPTAFLDDVAQAYLLALELAPAGSEYNLGSAECELRRIAEGIATLFGQGEAVSTTVDELTQAIGPLYALSFSSNVRVSSDKARAELGWDPKGPSLLDELVHGSYRRVWVHREAGVVTA